MSPDPADGAFGRTIDLAVTVRGEMGSEGRVEGVRARLRDDGGSIVAESARDMDLPIRGGALVELQLHTAPGASGGALLILDVSIRDATGARTLRVSLAAAGSAPVLSSES